MAGLAGSPSSYIRVYLCIPYSFSPDCPKSHPPKAPVSARSEPVSGLLGVMLFEVGIPFLSLDPQKKAIAKTGVLFISMDFGSSEKRFASQ
jgi:hypothetical protein